MQKVRERPIVYFYVSDDESHLKGMIPTWRLRSRNPGAFPGTLDQVLALALFMPVVLPLAESGGIQSLTLTLQCQHGKGGTTRGHREAGVLREIPLGLRLEVSCALLVALAAWLWQAQTALRRDILVSIMISVTSATLLGMLVPRVPRLLQRDPKVALGPIALALTDSATLFFYLGLATVRRV